MNVSTANNLVGQQRVKTYECPSDTLAGRLEVPASGPRPGGQQWMHGSYRAVSGKMNLLIGHGNWDGFEPQLWPGNRERPVVPRAAARHRRRLQRRPGRERDRQRHAHLHHGRAGDVRRVHRRPVEHPDGRRVHVQHHDHPGHLLGVHLRVVQPVVGRGREPAVRQALRGQRHGHDRVLGHARASTATSRASGRSTADHTGGANFALGDGSVRFISYNVDMNLLAEHGHHGRRRRSPSVP